MSSPDPTTDPAAEPRPGLVARLRSPVVLAGIGAAVVGTVAALLLRSGGSLAPPEVRRERALVRLDERTLAGDRAARSIARRLVQEEYTDPEHGWTLDFVLGTVAFRTAVAAGELATQEQFVEAIEHLRDAERRTLPVERQAEWAYAMGVSLARIGATGEAGPYLRRAAEAVDDGTDVGPVRDLVDAILVTGDRDLLEHGLRLNGGTLSSADAVDRDRLLLQRAQLLSALGRLDEANTIFGTLSDAGRATDDATLFRGRTLLAERRHAEAVSILEPVADRGDESRTTREAGFLVARASEAMNDVDNAIRFYQLVADRDPEGHEGIAARLRAAELLRRAGRREESLDAFRRLFQHTPPAAEFHNRWLSLDEFRTTVVAAWNELLDEGSYADAIELAAMLDPLYPGAGSLELVARATKRWAEDAQAEYDAAPFSQRSSLRTGVVERWRAAGDAYDELAEALRTTTDFGPSLYEAARHHARGHRFEAALARLDQFIETRPRELLPEALLQRGHTLFDLGRIEDALAQFTEVAERFPTSPTSYEARFEIGRCHLEEDRRDEAERAWSAVLSSPDLGPTADVWKKSLFAVAKLSYHWARAEHRAAARPQVDEETAAEHRRTAYARWDDAIARLGEYLHRYPDGADTVEARFLLARALLDRADEPRRELRVAETENTRIELRNRIDGLLRRSIDEFRILQQGLRPLEVDDRLDAAELEFLNGSYVDVARAYYDLQEYNRAIVTYAAAANRLPDDPRVLVCYVQMSNAYSLQGKPVEARSMLQQARLILQRMPDDVFEVDSTNLSRADWVRWIEWARERVRTDDAPPPATAA